jgi:hypothetical protein
MDYLELELENKVSWFLVRFVYLRFLKKLKGANWKKYNILNIYFLHLKFAVRKMVKNVKTKINVKNLKKASLMLNYCLNCKYIISRLKKNFLRKPKFYNLGYDSKAFRTNLLLKTKIFFLIKSHYLKKKFKPKEEQSLHIFYEKYLKRRFVKFFIKKHYLTMMPFICKQMICKRYLIRLHTYSKNEKAKTELDRLSRKFNFKWKILRFFHKFKKKWKENFKVITRNKYERLFLRKFTDKVAQTQKRKFKNALKEKEIKSIFSNYLISKIKSGLIVRNEKKVEIFKAIRKLEFLIKLIMFKRVKVFIQNINKQEIFNKIWFNHNLFIYKTLRLKIKRNFFQKSKKQFFDEAKFRQLMKQDIKRFYINIKLKNRYKINYNMAQYFNDRKIIKRQIPDLFSRIYKLLHRKANFIKALLNFRKRLCKVSLASFKINRASQKEKRTYYNVLKDQREKVIFSELTDSLIKISTSLIKKNEENITNSYIRRREKGLKMALFWYKKLKNLIILKKVNQLRSPKLLSGRLISTIVENQYASSIDNYSSTQIKDEETYINKLKEDTVFLINLRKKERAKPRKLEF